MKRLLLFAAACFFGFATANAQLVQVVNEVVMDEAQFYTDNPGALPGAYPAGGVTYRVFAECNDVNDFVTSVFAIDNCYNMEIRANDAIWNTGFGGQTGSNINPGFFALAPEVQWDSFVDIGRTDNGAPGGGVSTAAANPANYWGGTTSWNAAPLGLDFELEDGAWFVTNGDPAGVPTGPNNRVFLFQVTTTEALSYRINVQVIDDVTGSQLYVWNEIDDLVCGSGTDDTDGSSIGLIFPFVPGCTDPLALNFDPAATADDGSCIVPACPAVAESFCYGNNDDGLLINADGADPIVLEVTSSDVEICCDDFNIYDGSDNTGTLLAGPLNGDQAGLLVEATSGNMFVEFLSDGSVSCQDGSGPFDYNLYCGTVAVLGCTDGDAANFNPAATNDDGSCVVPTCDPFDDNIAILPALAGESECYGAGSTTATYEADPGEQVTISVVSGEVESGFDSFTVYDGQFTTDPVILTADGVLDGIAATSTSGFITIEWNGDAFGADCGDATFGSTIYDVYCGSTFVPPVLGCTDPLACNFDPLADTDDGSCITPAANDLCADAIALSPGTITINNENACQNEGIAGSCHFSGDDEDASLWYTFTTPANDAEVTIYTTNPGGWTDTQLTVFDGCGGAELYCDDDDDSGTGLPVGGTLLSAIVIPCGDLATSTTYTVQVDAFDTSSGDVDLVLEIDEAACTGPVLGCIDADALNFDPAATADDGSCILASCDADDGVPPTPALNETYCYANNDDVTFSYEADPGEQVTVFFNAGTFEGTFDFLTIYDGQTTADPVLIGPIDGDVTGISATSTSGFLTIRFEGDTSNDCDGGIQTASDWDVYCGSTFTPPVLGCTDPLALNFDPAADTDDGSCITPNCPAVAETYCYTNGVNGFTIVADGADPIVLEVLSSALETCCDDFNIYDGSDNTGTLLAGPLTGDQAGLVVEATSGNMFVEFDADGSVSCIDGSFGTGPFDYNVYCGTPAIEGCTNPAFCEFDPAATVDDGSCVTPLQANDDCANAAAIAVPGSATVDNECSTPDGPTIACGAAGDTSADNDVWYSFVAPAAAAGLVVIETSGDGTFTLTDTQMQVLDACGGTVVECDDDGNGLFSRIELQACDLVEGATYFIQVDGWGGDEGTCNLDITTEDISGCTDPASLNFNPCATIDDGSCIPGIAGALSVPTEVFPNCNGVAGATTLPGEGTGLPSNGPFGGDPDDEVFYEFIAACDGGVKVKVEGTGIDAVVELFDGSLNLLGAVDETLFGDDEVLFFDGVQAGANYYARVYDFDAGATGAFNICVSSFCASSVDDPYPTLTFDACDVIKCDFISGADNYDWDLQATLGGADQTYSTVGNNTFVQVVDFAPGVEYGEVYDVTINTNFTDADLGAVTVAGQTVDQMVMEIEPITQLVASNIGSTKNLNDYLQCAPVCQVDEYVWQITSDGGTTFLGPVTVAGSFAPVALVSDFTGVQPGTAYEAQIAIVIDGVQYSFGPLQPFNTAAAPLLEVRSDAWCVNGPISYGNYLVTNNSANGAVDFTWEFSYVSGPVPQSTFYWRKGNGVRILQAGTPSFAGDNLLVQGNEYAVRVRPEYGSFVLGDNSDPNTEPTYTVSTAYGAVQNICIVGPAPFTEEDVELRSENVATIEAAIYPNPTNGDFINLNLDNISEDEEKVMVDIYDLFGKLVQSEQIATTGTSNLNVVIGLNTELASGLYMVNITVGETMKTERLVIEK